jgi:transcriptional regulator with XRE-family HTH domain
MIETEAAQMRNALADFLRTRRARLSPSDVGLPGGARRRTPGLRREEVSLLANVGISWYTALEQGRDVRPSESILNSLADVLRLTVDERAHLFLLAGQHLVIVPTFESEEEKCPAFNALRQILTALEPNPAYVLGQRWDYRAWNETADRVFSITQTDDSPYAYNLVWQLFMNPEKRDFYVHWEKVAQNVVAEFRAEIEKAPCDAWVSTLIADLNVASPDFAHLWQQHDVQTSLIRRKEMHHAQVGRLTAAGRISLAENDRLHARCRIRRAYSDA